MNAPKTISALLLPFVAAALTFTAHAADCPSSAIPLYRVIMRISIAASLLLTLQLGCANALRSGTTAGVPASHADAELDRFMSRVEAAASNALRQVASQVEDPAARRFLVIDSFERRVTERAWGRRPALHVHYTTITDAPPSGCPAEFWVILFKDTGETTVVWGLGRKPGRATGGVPLGR